jgi:redox-sensitive bicupin YhaK (pirin superfamily)
MLTLRPASARGRFDHGWLDTAHTFSFGRYVDRAHTGFRALRVINEDRVAPGRGFGEHPHADMEILSYVLSGSLAHRDSLGNTHAVGPGQVQRMSAGSGIEHAEFNPSSSEPVQFYQVWIHPDAPGGPASYEQRAFAIHEQTGRLHLLASPDGAGGSMRIGADARVLAGVLEPGQEARVELAPGRGAWVQVARGEAKVNGQPMSAGDGAAITGEAAVDIEATSETEVLVFDLA